MKKWMLLLIVGGPVAFAQKTPPLPDFKAAMRAAMEAVHAPALPTTAPATAMPGSFPGPTTATVPVKPAHSRVSSFPRTVAAAKPMPKEFDLVVTRSIFIKGLQYRGPDKTNTEPRDPRSSEPRPTLARPEKNLLFNGAMDADGQWIALVEDISIAKVLTLKVGDKVAGGKVAAMTLGTLDYDANGKVKRILMGQNLDGEAVSIATTRPALATTGPTTESLPGPMVVPLSGPGGAADILEQMRLRRQQGK